MSALRKICTGICFTLALSLLAAPAQAQQAQDNSASAPGVLTKCEMDAGFAVGGAFGVEIFGTSLRHNLGLGTLDLGEIISDTQCAGHWYEGDWEVLAEVFGGGQVDGAAGGAYVIGLTPSVRYNFITHTRWVPFLEAGAGGSYTDIHRPDLSTKFEFNLQLGMGVHYFFCPDLAATFQARLLHLSNASIESPNHGVNTVALLMGLNWFWK